MRILPVLLATILLLASCAEAELGAHVAKSSFPRQQQQGNFKVGNPYKVEGQTYTPQETYSFTETGIASWYGPGFQGKRTANGEKFDKNELTAAHRTLQMPSLVRVTNLDNGRSLVVRINDRGPFKRGRVIDLSERAASLLGYKGIGTAKVRIDLLSEESKQIAMSARQGQDTKGVEVAVNENGYQPISYDPNAPIQQPVATNPDVTGHVVNGEFYPDPMMKQYPVTPSSIYVQTGSFTNAQNAQNLATSLNGFGQTRVVPALVNGQQFYRVRLGPVADVTQADTLLSRLSSAGHKQAITVVE